MLYLQILEPHQASYGITNYTFAISQLAQTTLRSEVGKIDLDRTFEERASLNSAIVNELDQASAPWGVKVLRYEIRNITPPADVLAAMEKQMRAEREKRAVILASEGDRDAKINESQGSRDANINEAEGEKQRVIKASEAVRTQQINEAQGQAEAIVTVAAATADGLSRIAQSVSVTGGMDAMRLRIAEQYIAQFGQLAKESNTLVVPANLSDLASMLTLASTIVKGNDAVSGSGP